MVYFSGKVCPSCIEDLLLHFSKNEKVKKRTLIFVNSDSKQEIVLSFNDKCQHDYKYLYDSTEFIEPKNEILVLKLEKNDIKYVLVFKPDEKVLFNKYFKMFFKNKN